MKKPFYTRPRMHRDILAFAHPFNKQGEPRVYTSILLYLHERGVSRKKDILINGLGRTGPFYGENPNWPNGYLSSMFSDLQAAGLIKHWGKGLWTIGDRYEEWKEWLRRGEGL